MTLSKAVTILIENCSQLSEKIDKMYSFLNHKRLAPVTTNTGATPIQQAIIKDEQDEKFVSDKGICPT